MYNIYELFEKCIQSVGTTSSYCSKAINDIIPSKKFQISNVNIIHNLNIKSTFDLEINHCELSDWKIVNYYEIFTNDDASKYLKSLMEILKDANYVKDYNITLSDTDDSLVTIMESLNEDKKSELYDIFDELPVSFNSRVLAYLK